MIFTIALKMIADAAFEQVGNPISTNWCIAVHFFDFMFYSSACMQISLLLSSDTLMVRFIHLHRNFYSYLFNIIGVIYLAYAFIELSYINASFEKYNVAMFDANYALSQTLLVSFSVLLYFALVLFKKKYKQYTYV